MDEEGPSGSCIHSLGHEAGRAGNGREGGKRAAHHGEVQVDSVSFRSYRGLGGATHTLGARRGRLDSEGPGLNSTGEKCLDCASQRLSVSFTRDLNTKHFG